MQHPHSSQVQKVIDVLESVLPMATMKESLRMSEGRVNTHNHACGTVHCHGGWFAIGSGLHTVGHCDFNSGANLMAKILGFQTGDVLEEWAKENETIWGNSDGFFMFSNNEAFESPSRPSGALNLQHIIDHWKEVKGRLQAIERAADPIADPYSISASSELASEAMKVNIEIDVVVTKEIVNN